MKNYRPRPLGPIGVEPPEARFLDTLDAIHANKWTSDSEDVASRRE